MADLGPELRRLLRKAGCEFVRQGATNHQIWRSPKSNRHFTVPAKIKNRHTANGVLKDAGLPKAF